MKGVAGSLFDLLNYNKIGATFYLKDNHLSCNIQSNVDKNNMQTTREASKDNRAGGRGKHKNPLLNIDLQQGVRSLEELEREFGEKKGSKNVTSPTRIH